MRRVLVVDDTKNIRVLLTKCLEMEGYEVKTANDGQKAVEMFLTESFDLAFLDIKMPCYSGTEVLKQIREKGITTPVIIITAYATVKNAVECTQMGAVAYLQKPFTADKVRGKLNEIALADGNCIATKIDKLIDAKNYNEAFTVLKKHLQENPLDANTYLLLSRVSEYLGNFDESKKYFKIYEIIK